MRQIARQRLNTRARTHTHTHAHTQVLELDKYNTHALHNRGISFDKLGLYHKALADLTEVETRCALSSSLFLSFSLSLSLSHTHIHAHAHTPQAVRLDPQNASALFNRGSALDSLGILVHHACARARARTHAHTHMHTRAHHLLVPIFTSIRTLVSYKLTKRSLLTLQDNSTKPSPTSPRRSSSTWRARSRENPDST